MRRTGRLRRRFAPTCAAAVAAGRGRNLRPVPDRVAQLPEPFEGGDFDVGFVDCAHIGMVLIASLNTSVGMLAGSDLKKALRQLKRPPQFIGVRHFNRHALLAKAKRFEDTAEADPAFPKHGFEFPLRPWGIRIAPA